MPRKVIKSADTGKFVSKAKAKADPKGTYVQTGEDYERIAVAVGDALEAVQDTIALKIQNILDGIPYRVVQLLKKGKR